MGFNSGFKGLIASRNRIFVGTELITDLEKNNYESILYFK